ncbi:MAG: ATP-binding protein [Nanoarchaeota archaeon]|nr:ATP-binding protein [Nanoarchaeota archaeon]
MEEKIFINRKDEMSSLLSALKRKGAELMIVYGRRRVGKSRLLREIRQQIKIGLFVMLEEADYATNLKKAAGEAMKEFGFPSFSPSSFRELFKAIPDGTIVFLDEYSYIAGSAGEFQAIWEETAKPKGIKIVLSGSLMRVMEDLNYSLKSPLYGRATKIIKLMPLNLAYVREWYGTNAKFEDILITYFCVGGIPRYLEVMEKPGQGGIKETFFSKEGLLLREGKLFIKESFPYSLVIPKIMFSIANGETEAAKIANTVQIKGSEIGKYLSLLSDYGLVEKKYPVLGGGKKDVRFYPGDRLFSFWNRFVWPYYDEIEAGSGRWALDDFEAGFSSFCGHEFEKAVAELITLYPKILPVDFTAIGRQWGRVPAKLKPETGKGCYEIDMCAINEKTKDIVFCECKWKKKVDAGEIAKSLLEKSKFVEWRNAERKESFAVFAKTFSRKITELEGRKVYCFDLKEIEAALR